MLCNNLVQGIVTIIRLQGMRRHYYPAGCTGCPYRSKPDRIGILVYTGGWYGLYQITRLVIVIQGVMVFALIMCNRETLEFIGLQTGSKIALFKITDERVAIGLEQFGAFADRKESAVGTGRDRIDRHRWYQRSRFTAKRWPIINRIACTAAGAGQYGISGR